MSNDSRPRLAHFIVGVIIIYLTLAGIALLLFFILKFPAVDSIGLVGATALIYVPFMVVGYRLLKIRLGGREAISEAKKKVESIRLGLVFVQLLILLPIAIATSIFAITYFMRFGICITALVNAALALIACFLMISPFEKLVMKLLL